MTSKEELSIIDLFQSITPVSLSSSSYKEQLDRIVEDIKKLFKDDVINFVTTTQTIKNSCPCYRRDLLIEVLDRIIFGSDNLISDILSQLFLAPPSIAWKETANSLVSLPDIVANCNMLNKFVRFKMDNFYQKLVTDLYVALNLHINDKNDSSMIDQQKWFILTILGRVSIISGFSIVVWEKFTQKVLESESALLKSLVGDIITLPLYPNNIMSAQFDNFIEPLILPIFYNLKPTQKSGELIHELLHKDDILFNDSFEYIICHKMTLHSNYNQTRHRQKTVLFNIFSYLSYLTSEYIDKKYHDNHQYQTQLTPTSSSSSSSSPSLRKSNSKRKSPLVRTLVTIAQNWSNKSNILLRTEEHNRYIGSALLIAFRFALEYDKKSLVDDYSNLEYIESALMDGFTIYLDRASFKLRNLAMCLGEILLPKIHELLDIDRKFSGEQRPEGIKFDIKWDKDCLELKNLFYLKIEELFESGNSIQSEKINDLELSNEHVEEVSVKSVPKKELIISDIENSFNDLMNEKSPQEGNKIKKNSKKCLIEVLDEVDDEDLVPYDSDDEVVNGVDDLTPRAEIGQDLAAPIYLSDCINGLIENKNASYVKLCLMKAGNLIEELSIDRYNPYQESTIALSSKQSSSYKSNQLSYIKSRSKTVTRALETAGRKANKANSSNDAISDNAIELAKILLYLDDQFNIEGFSGLRMRALICLAIVAPELVVKYLLDEFNGDNRNIRHQLDILQVLINSAQNLSNQRAHISEAYLGKETTASLCDKVNRKDGINGFAKYALLYFYGIIHRLKISTHTNIALTDRQWLDSKDASYFESRDNRDKSPNTIDRFYTATTTFINDMKKEKRDIMKTNIINNADDDYSSGGGDVDSTGIGIGSSSISGGGGSSSSRKRKDDNNENKTTTTRLDDSYLLSRVLFSISLIIKCLNQQPVTCKLSNDLLDVLAAYRYHPDSGVRKSIVSCLIAIKDSTPEVYFGEYLSGKCENLFGPFLAIECDLIGRLRSK